MLNLDIVKHIKDSYQLIKRNYLTPLGHVCVRNKQIGMFINYLDTIAHYSILGFFNHTLVNLFIIFQNGLRI